MSSPVHPHEPSDPPSARSYDQAERFLLDLVNYEVRPPPMCADREGWHLREFGRLLRRLGNPERAFPIVHVAGTKGKGSTTRFLVSLLAAQGWKRVGAFTSPHLESFRERISIDGKPVFETAFVQALRAVRGAHPELRAEGFRTTFEMLTAMAFWTFRRRKCEAVVLETGLGGRLDSTNAAPSRVAVITAIGYDHQRVLGRSIEAIAREKAGIVKPGARIAVLGPQPSRHRAAVIDCVRRRARSVKVPLRVYDPRRDPIRSAVPDGGGFSIDVEWNGRCVDGIRLNLLGRHQLDNLRTALLALDAFARVEKREIRPDRLRAGIENARSPGRMEIVRRHPLVIADGAHCGLSARAAAAACADHLAGRPIVLVLGALRDKNHRAIVEGLARNRDIREVFVYPPDSPRACPAENLAALASRRFRRVRAFEDEGRALAAALEIQERRPDTVVLASGSTYGVATVRRLVSAS
ncbi:bifunctional folylpolyglutamate synthase/dihydrofolate synthase [Candidatus Sumerlaeota bacterium]|nr:bifunctional folylpolyglutamate synthase/dihydrofolate synthase [Candidatus Sumerlaeota bacterium]